MRPFKINYLPRIQESHHIEVLSQQRGRLLTLEIESRNNEPRADDLVGFGAFCSLRSLPFHKNTQALEVDFWLLFEVLLTSIDRFNSHWQAGFMGCGESLMIRDYQYQSFWTVCGHLLLILTLRSV